LGRPRGSHRECRVVLGDLWCGQDYYLEVWIEKDALVGVIEGVCERWDVPYFSCRGYPSQSEMWGASQRLLRRIRRGSLEAGAL
jgi:hypothetical protein